ncbi:MAG: EAL domain-containing protein [Kurthia sp.]|nr:EAL domain-containing protein [Candidatus Kurthia equi]
MRENTVLDPTIKNLIDNLPHPFLLVNEQGEIVLWNKEAQIKFGYTAEEIIGFPVPFVEQSQISINEMLFQQLLKKPEPMDIGYHTYVAKSSERILCKSLLNVWKIEETPYLAMSLILSDSSTSESTFEEELSYLRSGLEDSFMMLSVDNEGLITSANTNFLKQSKWTPKRILGKTFWQMFPQTDVGTKQADKIWESLKNGRTWHGEVEQITKDGQPYWVELSALPISQHSTAPTNYLLLENDITDKKTLQHRLEKIAYIDQETGLMNRFRLEQLVNKMIEESQHFTFVFLSIDKFYSLKEIYDDKAEAVLVMEFTNRMKMYFQDSIMARVSVNDFVVLTPLGEWFIQGFLSYLKQHPIYLDNTSTPLTISGGITKFPEDQNTFSNLFKASNTVIQKIQSEGGDSIASLSKDDHKSLSTRSVIERRLLIALNQKDLHVLYQPQRDLSTDGVTTVEALVRWEDSEIGIVPPDILIPIAEETGLINQIGNFMLEKACEQAVEWSKAGHKIRVSVNTSIREFRDKNMADTIRKILDKTNCPADLLQIEITEKFALEAEAETSIVKQMKQLQVEGVKFSLDDFGTGYASFRYMQLLPLEEFKIDKSFISSVTYQDKTRALVEGMIQFGKSLQLRVVAEGVETDEQEMMLRQAGCDAIQGYYISRPTSASEIEKYFKA